MTCKPDSTHHNACDCREEYVKKLEKENERYLWNLAGCSTFALGYDDGKPYSKELALPALEDVLRMAQRVKKLERVVKAAENEFPCELAKALAALKELE